MENVYSEGVPLRDLNPTDINNPKWGTRNPKNWASVNSVNSTMKLFFKFDQNGGDIARKLLLLLL